MATQVYTTEVIELQDGTEITLRPMVIKIKRRFSEKLAVIGTVPVREDLDDKSPLTDDESYDQLLDIVQICLTNIDSKIAGNRNKIEEVLDEPTMYKIIEVCGGIKLNDPNLLAAAAAIATETESQTEGGTN